MYIVIVNSLAGQNRYNKIMKKLKKYLHTSFLPYFSNEFQGDEMWDAINNTITQKKEDLIGIIVVGGDGTLHHTVQKLHKHGLPIGLVASGSGNDFGRALQIPSNTKKAIRRILKNDPKTYDLLEVNDRKVLSIIGIGVDAETAIQCQNSRTKRLLNKAFLGRLTYLMVFLRTIFHYRPLHILIEDEHRKIHDFDRVWLMAAGNTSYYGGGIPICPTADPQDGKIELVIVHGLNLFQLILALPSVFIKKHLFLPYVTALSGTRFTVTTKIGQASVQGDGEDIGKTPATINLVQKGIKVF